MAGCGWLLSNMVMAQDAWPLPSPFPVVPAGAMDTTYPMPRIEWLQQVKANLNDSRATPGSIKMVFDGDSITAGWPNRARQIWVERFAKLGTFNFAMPGDGTQHLLWRLSQGQGEGLHPRLIVLMIGTNNTSKNSAEEIAAGIKKIVEAYRTRLPEAAILLLGIFPRGEKPADPARDKIAKVNAIISALGDGKRVIYMDLTAKFLDADGMISREIMPDFLHPSPKGYEIWADAIQPIVEKYCADKPSQNL